MAELVEALAPLAALLGVAVGVMLAFGPPFRMERYGDDPEREQRRARRASRG